MPAARLRWDRCPRSRSPSRYCVHSGDLVIIFLVTTARDHFPRDCCGAPTHCSCERQPSWVEHSKQHATRWVLPLIPNHWSTGWSSPTARQPQNSSDRSPGYALSASSVCCAFLLLRRTLLSCYPQQQPGHHYGYYGVADSSPPPPMRRGPRA